MVSFVWRHILPVLVLATLAVASPRADVAEDASDFVTVKAGRLLEIMVLPPGPERHDDFASWLVSAIDLDHLARRALGRYFDVVTDDQLVSYEEAFRNYILMTYEKRLDFFAGYEFAVVRSRTLSENDAVVRTTIRAPDGGKNVVDFRVGLDDDGHYRVTDLAIEGLSMRKTLRDEFASVIRRDGIDGLIELLNSHAAGASQ